MMMMLNDDDDDDDDNDDNDDDDDDDDDDEGDNDEEWRALWFVRVQHVRPEPTLPRSTAELEHSLAAAAARIACLEAELAELKQVHSHAHTDTHTR